MTKHDDAASLLHRLDTAGVEYRNFEAAPMPQESRQGWKLLAAVEAAPAVAPAPIAEPDPEEEIEVTEELPIETSAVPVLPLEDEPVIRAAPEAGQKKYGSLFRRGPAPADPAPGETALAQLFKRIG